ncbi:hypothetical protein SAMN05216389_101234 [Oceanobacillus limi]|uniref:Uncharacterized protein n=1 Tax=Oceanobacillus limi TaxID=930131 RepID=A0A1H9Y712_9BACI|nr:hypothetical protein [Oceanobacillus limi]SES64681.1 hypothetical protein SAMN05216389_101234 [Oceanobacillus limi]
MEKIIYREETSLFPYMVITFLSIVTFRKIDRVEKRRIELKEEIDQEKDKV